MKILATYFLVLVAFTTAQAASSLQHEVSEKVRVEHFSVKKQLVLEGYDVVSYQQAGGPKEGSQAHEGDYKGVTYRFSSAANKATFFADPERYEPLYGGWCAYAMLDGGKTKVNPESFKIVDDRLLVFYDGIWGDTLKQWNEKSENDAALIKTADAEWAKHLK
ncbi:MAG: YHS domain-containing (seleno)protein [Opitutaceae bacterium]